MPDPRSAHQPRRLILHHHLFKNAGSSLDRALEQALGQTWANYDSDDPAARLLFDDVRDFLEANPAVKALSSHQLLPDPAAGDDPSTSHQPYELFPIVILREPISRVRSAYLFEWQKQLGLDSPKGSLSDYIIEKLQPARESVIGDFHINRLSAAERTRHELRSPDLDGERTLRLELAERYLDSLRLFGLVERFPEFIKLLNVHLGGFDHDVPVLGTFHANRLQGGDGSSQPEPGDVQELIRADIGQTLYDELVERNRGDITLYAKASRRFDRMAAGLTDGSNDGSNDGSDNVGKANSSPTVIDVSDRATPGEPLREAAASEVVQERDRLERRVAWQQEIIDRTRQAHQQDLAKLEALRGKYAAAKRQATAAKATEPDVPDGVLPDRKLARAVRLAQEAVTFANRAVGYAERRVKDYPVSHAHQHLRAKLAASGLFDVDYYTNHNPDVINDGGWDPIDHYLIHGGFEGRAASELFDTAWYLEQNPDVVEAGWQPLIHYLDHGEREGRQIRGVDPDAFGDEPSRHHPGLPQPEHFADVAANIQFAELAEGEVDITIAIPIYNAIDYTLACLQSLTRLDTSYRFEVVLMDDCSTDPDVDVLSTIRGLRYHRNQENQGFLGTCNRAADLARGQFLVLLNNDTQVDANWLDALRSTFDQHDGVGIVGSKLVYPDGRLQEAGGIVWADAGGWNWGRLEDPSHPRYNFVRDVDYASAASIMIPLALFNSLGQFDDRYRPAYYEDTDLCFAARKAGWRVLYQPASVVVHYEGISSGTDLGSGVKRHQVLNRMTFAEKWADELEGHGENGVALLRASDRAAKGHVLIVDACTPTPDQDSGSLDMINLISIIGSLGYRVHFVPLHEMSYRPGYTDRLQQLGAVCVTEPYYQGLEQYLEEAGHLFDSVILSRVDPAAAAIDAVLEHCPQAKLLFYTVDLHHLRDRREAELTGDAEAIERADARRSLELEVMDRVDVTILLSEAERQILESTGRRNLAVLPLIRDVSEGNPAPFEERSGVVFVGGFRHTPNVDAVEWLMAEVWPAVREEAQRRGQPTPHLNIIGSHTPDRVWRMGGNGVSIHGFVENLRPLVDQARLTIAPLRYGAGLKGKVATSLDAGVPVVGTDMAFEGMPLPGLDEVRHAANTPEDLARLVLDLYTDRLRWLEASVAGRRYVRQNYSIEALTPVVADLLGVKLAPSTASPDIPLAPVLPLAPTTPAEQLATTGSTTP